MTGKQVAEPGAAMALNLASAAEPLTWTVKLAGRGLGRVARLFVGKSQDRHQRLAGDETVLFVLDARDIFLLTIAAGKTVAIALPDHPSTDRLAGLLIAAGARVIRGHTVLANAVGPVAIPVVSPCRRMAKSLSGLDWRAAGSTSSLLGRKLVPLGLASRSARILDPGVGIPVGVPMSPIKLERGRPLSASASLAVRAAALEAARDASRADDPPMPEPPPRSVSAYRIAMGIFALVSEPYLAWRARKGKEDPDRKDERFGRAGVARAQGRIGWVHAASVGESVSILPLIRRLLDLDDIDQLVVTTGTMTSAEVMAARLPLGAVHQYIPLDCPSFVATFADNWRPEFAVFVESEIWPNIFSALKQRHIPIAIVNGRMSARSFERWRARMPFISSVLASTEICIAQNDTYAQRYARLGAPHVATLGNIKFDSPPLPAPDGELQRLEDLTRLRTVWLAASTHPGEEEIIAEAHLSMREKYPNLLTILVPRHPERGEDVATLLEDRWLATARRSSGAEPRAVVDVYVADTIGELGLFYRLCDVAFLGGSLTGIGGHNPVEAANLDCAILHGPFVHNFRDMFETFDDAGAAVEVAGAGELSRHLDRLMGNPVAVEAMVTAGREVLGRNAGSLDRAMTALMPLVNRRQGRDV